MRDQTPSPMSSPDEPLMRLALDQAINAQRAGAKAYLVATDHSDRHKLQPMPAAPDQAKVITIPGAMITKASGALLQSIVLPPQQARDPGQRL